MNPRLRSAFNNPLDRRVPAGLLASLVLLAAGGAQAATQYAAGAFTWGTDAKWAASSGGSYASAWTSGNDAVFEGAAGTVGIAAAGVTAHNLTFNTTGYLIQNNTLTLNGTAPTISTDIGITATVASVIAGSAGLTKAGTGTLVLTASNSYSGPTIINAGTLALADSSVAPPAGAVLHLDASTLSLANGAAVTALANLGTAGSSLDAAPTVTGQYPTFNAAALNGRGTIHMTGQQGLQTANNLGITGNADRSIFVVMARGNGNTNATGSMYLQTGTVGGNNSFGIGDCYNTLYLPYTYSANDQTTTTRPALTYDLLEALHTSAGNANYGYVNGTVVGPKSVTTTTTDGRVQIGYRSGDNTQVTGDFAEVLIYNSYLNDVQRQQVEAYLRAKWLTGSLPTGSLPAATALSIAAGATFDVSVIPAYTLGGSNTMTASGTGTTPGTDAAVIKGNSSGTVDLGSRPVTLNFTPASVAGDTTHPALLVSQGALTLNGAITVNIGGSSPLGAGTYRLISQTSGSISGTPTLAATTGPGSNHGLAANATAVLQITGGQLNLLVSAGLATPTVALTRHSGTGSTTTYGDALSFDVAVTPNSPTAPTGLVTLKDGGASGTSLGSYTLGSSDNGVCTITPALNALKAGSHTNIVAVYDGDLVNFTGGTSAALSTRTVSNKTLTIAGAAAQNKTYDGTATATLSGTLAGVVSGDSVTLTLAGYFADAAAGTGKSVTSTSTIDAASQANYTLTQPAGLTADIVTIDAVLAEMGVTVLRHSVVSDVPAATWEKAMVTGNGIQGAMAMGWAPNETIVLNHAGLFLPLYPPFSTVNQATILTEVRQKIAAGQFGAAADQVFALGATEGKDGTTWTDPFVPACSLQVGTTLQGTQRDYLRSTDFSTGVTGTRWADDSGAHLRRLFVSRPDNVVVLSLTGANGVDCDLNFTLHDSNVGGAAPPPGSNAVNGASAAAEATGAGGWLTFGVSYTRRWTGSLQGCEAAARVIATGGTTTAANGKLTVRGASEVLVLVRTVLSRDIAQSQLPALRTDLGALDGSYETLLARHAAVHGEIMNRCQLEVGGSDTDHHLTAPELFAQSGVGALNPALLEKEFDACRYLALSSSGTEYPPALQGIWGATWSPSWSSDYTQNGNLQTVVSGNLMANMPEAMEGFFHYLESQLPDYRDNALQLFGTRGIHVPSRSSTHGLLDQFLTQCPVTFWTAGAAWNAQFFYDYWLTTGDQEFLLEHALPWMKEAAAFYEDFLYLGLDGKWEFNPSFSPENNGLQCGGFALGAINSAIDTGAARELFTNLVTVCGQLGIENENVAKWQGILAKMPDYKINADGAVAEWNTPLLHDCYSHRHASHLYGLFAGLPADIAANPALQAAFKVAIEKRMQQRRANNGGDMAFGLCQLGWAATSLREAEQAYETVDFLANNFWFAESMVTSHNVRSIFNTDLAGGLPRIILTMLVQAEPGRLELLPALPNAWPTGRVTGVLGRGGIEVRELAWQPGMVTTKLRSAAAQVVAVRLGGSWDMAVTGGTTTAPVRQTDGTWLVALPAGGDVTLRAVDSAEAQTSQYATGTFTWDNGTSAAWASSSGGSYTDPWSRGNNAVFEGGAGTVSVAVLGATAHNLTFNTTGFLVQNNTLTLNGVAPTISLGAGINATIRSIIGGGSGLTKTGAGNLTLAGVNTYSGATSISAGTLKLAGPPSAPTSPPDGAVLHLDASTLALANGAAVTALANLGSGGASLTASPNVTGQNPTFNAAALNGLGTIHMTGQQGLITASNLGITGNADRSVFVVMRRASGANMNLTTGTLGYDVAYGISDQNTGVLYLPYTYGPSDLTFTAPPAGTYRIYEVTRSGNISYGYLNGVLQGSKNVAINTSGGKVQIGYRTDGQQVSGDLAEVLIYNSYLNDAQRQQVEVYLQAKWYGGTGSLPANTALTIAAGATFDVSAITHYTLGVGASLTACGTGTALGTDAAAITGSAGGTVDLGARPVTLSYDGAHPALVVSQGALTLGGNTLTVVVPGTALGVGVYTLVTTPSAISGTVNPTPSFAGGNGLVAGTAGVVSISGDNVVLTVTGVVGGYANWAAANGASADPLGDSNHNGVANGIEFFMGATPGNPVTPPPMVDSNGTRTWTIPYDPNAAASYKFQLSDDLSPTNWEDVLPGDPRVAVLTEPDRLRLALPGGATRKFCRLVVTPTP